MFDSFLARNNVIAEILSRAYVFDLRFSEQIERVRVAGVCGWMLGPLDLEEFLRCAFHKFVGRSTESADI
jgi:hypothetical protein